MQHDHQIEQYAAAKPFHLVRIGRTTHLGAHVDQRQTHHVAQKNIVRNNQYPVHKNPVRRVPVPCPGPKPCQSRTGPKKFAGYIVYKINMRIFALRIMFKYITIE